MPGFNTIGVTAAANNGVMLCLFATILSREVRITSIAELSKCGGSVNVVSPGLRMRKRST